MAFSQTKLCVSPQISVSPVPDEDSFPPPPPDISGMMVPTLSSSLEVLAPLSEGLGVEYSDGDSRYFTASSGDEAYDDSDDEDMCITLDSAEDDNESLSGLHINLKTLQAVSHLLAHYTPIVQRDSRGNPMFVAPPPPPISEGLENLPIQKLPKSIRTNMKTTLTSNTIDWTDEDDSDSEINIALQELEDVITAEDHDFLHDKMTELTDVMQKMTYYAGGDDVDDMASTSSF